MKRWSVCLFLILVGFQSVEARELVYIGHEMEPFYLKSGSKGVQGAYYDLAQEICREQGAHCKFKIATFRSALDLLRDHKGVDMGGPFAATPQRKALFYYSPPLFKTRYCFFAHPKDIKKDMTYQDLHGQKVGVLGTSVTEISLYKVDEVVGKSLKMISEQDMQTCLRKAEGKVYPFCYVNCDMGRAWVERNRGHLKEIPQLGEETTYYILFSKESFSVEQAQSITDSIQTLRKKGVLKTIAEKYKIELADDMKMK